MILLFVTLLGLVFQVSIQERIEFGRIFASITDSVCKHQWILSWVMLNHAVVEDLLVERGRVFQELDGVKFNLVMDQSTLIIESLVQVDEVRRFRANYLPCSF